MLTAFEDRVLPPVTVVTTAINRDGDLIEYDAFGRHKKLFAADGSFYAIYFYRTNSCSEPYNVRYIGDSLTMQRFLWRNRKSSRSQQAA